ncbi:MAG: hypothetical protein KGM40_08835 [Betaproteobacteria bacterium]|nr:hypothetical protein [Betaproteobacteria bacterium]MDE2625509.1 hypothetical protein [Betaproteobacteria bacterium]
MKTHDHLTPCMQAILMLYNKGYKLHISFTTILEKIPDLDAKWSEDYGIRLPAHTRYQRKQRGFANAVALAGPVIAVPTLREAILMATPEALQMPQASAWSRQEWSDRYPRFSNYRMIKENRENGEVAMTWRLKDEELEKFRKYLVMLAQSANGREIARVTADAARFHPMFGGVRRQLRRTFREIERLWTHLHKTPYPGFNPEALPAMVGFKSTSKEPAGKAVRA